MTSDIDFNIPEKLHPFLDPYLFKVAYGGRVSTKTRTVAQLLIKDAITDKHLLLCAREIQNSINDSVKLVIENEIDRQSLNEEFQITKTEITHIETGSKFIFKGLGRNIESIKSIEGVTRVWIEEAEIVSQTSLDVLIPTIRNEGAELYITFNPKFEDDPVYNKFVIEEIDPKTTCVININFWDNPWFPEISKSIMEADKAKNYDKYLWVWEGQILKHSKEQVYYGCWSVAETPEPPDDTDIYYGGDFGFNPDPASLVRCWIDWDKNNLYIDYEAYEQNIMLSDYIRFYSGVPGSKKAKITADSARPDTIAEIRKLGYNIRAVSKDKIEDGIEWLKNFNIIIHPRCTNTIFEFTHYKHKVDKKTKAILPAIVDKHNHIHDALRYATRDLRGNCGFFNTNF